MSCDAAETVMAWGVAALVWVGVLAVAALAIGFARAVWRDGKR